MPRSRKDADKPRGRMSAYAFFTQTCREEQKRNRPNETLGFSDFSKLCSARWKDMSGQQKAPFQTMSEQDKKRFDQEMKNYAPTKKEQGGGKKASKKTKKEKDPNAPKRPLTAFFWFSSFERPRVAAMHPKVKYSEVVKELGKMWSAMDSVAKEKYVTMADRDKERYAKELEQYKNGGQLKENELPQVSAQANDVYAYAGEVEDEDDGEESDEYEEDSDE